MIHTITSNALRGILALFLLGTASAFAQVPNMVLVKRVQEMESHGDYSGITKLIDSEEALWKTSPNIAYFQNMFSIGDVLIGGTNADTYWLGRKALWKMLLKPTPNEYLAPQQFFLWRHAMFFLGAEDITPYLENLSPEVFAPVRRDTFLMLSEYARQLHATIIPGYRDKYSGAMNGSAERHRFMQNEIDNEIQAQARKALSLLATDHVNYLINAYSHDPRNDEELKMLLDILNVQGSDREKVMRDTR